MSATPDDLYSPCPCGSGKKYKFCCYAQDKEFGVKKKVQTSSHASVSTSGPSGFDTHFRGGHNRAEFLDRHDLAHLSLAEGQKFRKFFEMNIRFDRDNNIPERKKAILECLKLAPRTRQILREVIGVYNQEHDIDHVLVMCDRLITTCKSVQPADFAQRAHFRYIRGDDAGADADIAEAMRRAPETELDTTMICFFFALERQHGQIRNLCEKSPFKGRSDVMYYHGVALLNLGETDKAKKILQHVATSSQSRYSSPAKKYIQMIEAGGTPRTIFGDWSYFPNDTIFAYDLLPVEQVKAGGKHGRRTPSFHDRRWTLRLCEANIEAHTDSRVEWCVQHIALSKLPRAKDTLLALAAHPQIGDFKLKVYLFGLIHRFGIVKPGQTFGVYMPWRGEATVFDMPVYRLYVKLLFFPIWMIFKLFGIVKWKQNRRFNNILNRDLYAQYGKYAHPAPAEDAAQG